MRDFQQVQINAACGEVRPTTRKSKQIGFWLKVSQNIAHGHQDRLLWFEPSYADTQDTHTQIVNDSNRFMAMPS